jgi:hypothetical protein
MPDCSPIQTRRHRRVVRRKLPLTAHLDAEVVAELRGRQTMLGGSLSAVINQLLIEALRVGVEHEHGALIEQVISRTLEQRLWRLEALVRRVAVDAAQAKKLAYAAFTQADGVDLELARKVRDRARRDAWTDLHTALPDDFPMDEPAASRGEE